MMVALPSLGPCIAVRLGARGEHISSIGRLADLSIRHWGHVASHVRRLFFAEEEVVYPRDDVSFLAACANLPAAHNFGSEQYLNFCTGASSFNTACRQKSLSQRMATCWEYC
jgi:hypothetical protein